MATSVNGLFDSGGVPAVSSFEEVQGCCCTRGKINESPSQ